jgi:hypothetical protein
MRRKSMKEKAKILRAKVSICEMHIAELIANNINRAIKDGWIVKGMEIDDKSAGSMYLNVEVSKTVGHSRDLFDAKFSSRTKPGKMRAKKPLRCIDKDGPCTSAHASKTGKDCSGCGG